MKIVPRETDRTSGYTVSEDWIKEVKAELFKDKGMSRLSADAIDELIIYLSRRGYLTIKPRGFKK